MHMDVIACTSDLDQAYRNVATWTSNAILPHEVLLVGDGIEFDSVEQPVPGDWSLATYPDRGGPVVSLQRGYEYTEGDILAYIHDDVVIHEPGWDQRVLTEFDDPSVGVVGFGGALELGLQGIYRTPYRLQQLARTDYMSNVDDAPVHGQRFVGERDVVVLDGFSLIVRRKLLDKAGGWPIDHLMFHMYDAWLACMARRLGYRTRLVGVRCHHYGGRTSTQRPYNEWLGEKHGKTDADVHREAHEWVYDEFRDVLPLKLEA